MTEYRVRLAREMRNWPEAERLQRVCVDWDRRRAEDVLVRLAIRERGCDGSRSEPATLLDRLKAVADRLSDAIEIRFARWRCRCTNSAKSNGNAAAANASRRTKRHSAWTSKSATAPVPPVAGLQPGHAYKDIPAIRDLPQAERWYRRSLELTDERDRLGRGKCHDQLGYVAFERFQEARSAGRPEAELVGHLNTAVGFYHQALDLLPDNAVNDLAVTHNALGAIYRTAGDIDRALPHYREAIRYQEAPGNVYGAAETRFNVALALAQSGRVADAREYARAATPQL